MNSPKTIMIVEDHATFREGLKQVILGIDNLTLVGEAENGRVFIDLLEKTVPDIVLMDIMMPVMNGLEAVEIALKAHPDLRIIVISGHGEEEYLNSMILKGISGFVLKSARLSEIEKAIQVVMEGNNYYSQELTGLIIKKLKYFNTEEKAQLTAREFQVMRLLCKGKSTALIAKELVLSVRTIDGLRTKILQKTGQSNTINLIIHALQMKLITQEEIFNHDL
jgi:DNA-binding NarL/FixJ family response regulator